MTTRSIDNKIVVSPLSSGVSPIITSGLTEADTVICEDIEGWNTGDTIHHDIRQATFPTSGAAGVHVGATYSPKAELALRLVFTSTDEALTTVNSMNTRDINEVLHLVVVSGEGLPVAGYQVWYSGFNVEQFFNEGCRVAFTFTSNQALPTTY